MARRLGGIFLSGTSLRGLVAELKYTLAAFFMLALLFGLSLDLLSRQLDQSNSYCHHPRRICVAVFGLMFLFQ
jgi:hypothetical protein